MHDGKIGCNILRFSMPFLCFDWLYFLWHGINRNYSAELSDNDIMLSRVENIVAKVIPCAQERTLLNIAGVLCLIFKK